MTIKLHPSEENPTGYRVYNNTLKFHRTFPLTKKGKLEAEKAEQRIQERLRARKLIQESPNFKLFDGDNIKGFSIKLNSRKDRKSNLIISLYANNKHKQISLNSNSFEDAYIQARDWLAETHGIQLTYELRDYFNKSMRKYRDIYCKEYDKLFGPMGSLRKAFQEFRL